MPQTSIEAFVEPFRETYLGHLRASILARKTQASDLVTELALKINGKSWDDRFLLVRVDMVWHEEGQPRLANAELDELATAIESPTLTVCGLEVHLHSFRWNVCTIRLSPAPVSWVPIWEWFDHWFDLDEHNRPDAHGLTGVIHNLSEPEFNGESACIFTIDLGSAPAKCLPEFVAACVRAESTQMTIG